MYADKKLAANRAAAATPRPSGDAVLGETLEDLHAPELYGTAISSIAMTGSNVTLTLASSRFDNSVQPAVRRQVVVGRIVIPALAAADLAVGLYNFLVKQGISFKPASESIPVQ